MGGSKGWVMGRWDEGRRFGGWEIGNCIAPGSVYMVFGVGHGRHWFGIRYKLLQYEILLEKVHMHGPDYADSHMVHQGCQCLLLEEHVLFDRNHTFHVPFVPSPSLLHGACASRAARADLMNFDLLERIADSLSHIPFLLYILPLCPHPPVQPCASSPRVSLSSSEPRPHHHACAPRKSGTLPATATQQSDHTPPRPHSHPPLSAPTRKMACSDIPRSPLVIPWMRERCSSRRRRSGSTISAACALQA